MQFKASQNFFKIKVGGWTFTWNVPLDTTEICLKTFEINKSG